LDISPVAIDKLQRAARARDLAIDTRVVDVTQVPLKPNTYDVIVVSRFLDRNLAASLMQALGAGGLLFYQTFTQEHEGKGPKTSAFLLAPDELLRLFGPLRLRVYREEGRIGETTLGRRGEAMLVAQRT
jgi:SAM-dependent methyltransferase